MTAYAIALTVTCLTGAIPATAASASPLSGIMLPFEPGPAESPLPTKAQLQAAKSNPEQLRAMVDQLEATIEQARSRLVNAEALALDAQDGLLAADELLQERARTATEARSEAEKASEYLDSSKKNVGALASDLYRNGGINPGVVNLLDSDDDSDVLYKASTMGALSANRARTVSTAEEAVALWKAWQDYADAAETAANEATAAQLAAASKASSTMSTYEASIAPQEKLRSELIDQLAFLRDVDAKEEAARIAAKEAAAEAARLQELIDNTPPAPPVADKVQRTCRYQALGNTTKGSHGTIAGQFAGSQAIKAQAAQNNIAVVPEPENSAGKTRADSGSARTRRPHRKRQSRPRKSQSQRRIKKSRNQRPPRKSRPQPRRRPQPRNLRSPSLR